MGYNKTLVKEINRMVLEYHCPLCNQQVSKNLFEKITGIWEAQRNALKKFEIKKKEYLLQINNLKTMQ